MESKKSMSPLLIVLLSIIGICLVGFLVFIGVKYFKEGDNNNQIEQPSNSITNQETEKSSITVINDEEVNVENPIFVVYSSKNSENYNKVDYSKSFVLKPYDNATEEVKISSDNVITLNGYADVKDKSLKVSEKIVSALIDFDCGGSISIYYLTESKKLYFSNLYQDLNDEQESFKAFLIDTNVEKIGYANLNRFTTCGGKTIAYKKVGNSNNYKAITYYDYQEKKTIVSSKDMKYENYEEALNDGDHSNLLVIYKNYPSDLAITKNHVSLKDSNGNKLYVKSIFASSDQIKKGYNYLYFLGEDDYLYHYPNGYSAKNLKATKYNDSKVKKISSSVTEGYNPTILTIEYVNGKTEKINIDSYAGSTNLNL